MKQYYLERLPLFTHLEVLSNLISEYNRRNCSVLQVIPEYTQLVKTDAGEIMQEQFMLVIFVGEYTLSKDEQKEGTPK